jgi:hypothetical protein
MGESAPLRSRLWADLTDNQLVTVTAICLALVAFVLVSAERSPLPVSAAFRAEFLLCLSLLDMAFTYSDYWPVEYKRKYAVTWTVLFGVVTAAVFFVVYRLGLSHVGSTTASVAAFLTAVGAQFGSAVLYARSR